MKHFWKAFIVLVLILPAQVSAKTVKMAVFMLDPFMMEDPVTKKVVGVTVDYWKEFIAPEMGVDLEIAGIFPLMRATQMLRDGKVDVVSQLTKIPEREVDFLFPESSLTSIVSCLIVRQDSPLREVKGSEDLYGLSVGFIKEAFIPDMLKHERIKMELITTTDYREINYLKMINKRVDAMLDINHVSMKYWLEKRGYADQVRVILLPVSPTPVYSIFGKTEDGAALRDAFDKANKKGIAEKVFEKIGERYLTK